MWKLIEFREKGLKKNPDRRVSVFLGRISLIRERADGGADVVLIDSDSIDVSLEWGDYDKVIARLDDNNDLIEDVRDQLNKLYPEERVKLIEKMTNGYCKICGVYNGLNFECGCKPWGR